MNVDKKELVDELFKAGPNKDEKKSLAEIKEQISHFDQANYEILTLSEDSVQFKLLSVNTTKLRT